MSHKKTIKFIFSCAVSIIFLYFAFKSVEFKQLAEVFSKINYFWTVPFVMITLFSMWLRAVRWHWILKARYDFPSKRLFPSLVIGFCLNSVLPLRAGEFARPFILARKEKVPYSTILATVIVERIVDGITLIFSLFIVLLFVKIDPEQKVKFGNFTITGEVFSQLSQKFSIFILIFILGSISIIVNRTRNIYIAIIKKLPIIGDELKSRLVHLLEKFSHGFQSLKNPKYMFMIVFYSLLIWGSVGFSLQLMSFGFTEISLSFIDGMAVMIIICIAIMIPAAPGYWGLYECGGVFALIALGLASFDTGYETALGFSLVIHVLQIIPIVLAGFYYMYREKVSFSQMEHLAESENAEQEIEKKCS
jgi:glycosyltransferase 2 family protein